MRKTVKRNRYSKRRHTRRGGGTVYSKPKYPLLPPSPPSTPRNNKPEILTNNESLVSAKPGSKEYEERMARLLNIRERARNMYALMGRKIPKRSFNKYGYPKSAF